MSIQEHLNKIRNAIYGREVRESIAKGIETAYNDAGENGNANMEVKIARGTHPTLRDRLNEVDNTQQQTTAQLQRKISKGNGDVEESDLSQNVREIINGDRPLPIAEVDSILAENIVDGQVTGVKTDFIEVSKNLLDKYNMIPNKTIDAITGDMADHSVLSASRNFIDVDSNVTYTVLNVFAVALFDANGNYLRRWVYDESKLDTPQNFDTQEAKKIKFLVRMDRLDWRIQVNRGWTLLPYQPFNDKIDQSLIIPEKNIDGEFFLSNYNRIETITTPTGETEIISKDYNKYPDRLVWGHEYMYSWYEKVVNNNPLKMVWAGDSTTVGGSPSSLRRSALGKKIMTLGGYPDELVTTINAGHGGKHTGNWLGGDYDDGAFNQDEAFDYLDEDMAENPDLYVFAYGFNDGSVLHFPDLTWEQRIERFERNLNIGLERIRGQYNKSPDEMAVIICTPMSANGGGQQDVENWSNRIKPIMQKASRDYHCAFVDITNRQYDHKFSNKWSLNEDRIHPTGIANADYMSMFSDLLFPYLMHK